MQLCFVEVVVEIEGGVEEVYLGGEDDLGVEGQGFQLGFVYLQDVGFGEVLVDCFGVDQVMLGEGVVVCCQFWVVFQQVFEVVVEEVVVLYCGQQCFQVEGFVVYCQILFFGQVQEVFDVVFVFGEQFGDDCLFVWVVVVEVFR